jgi:hypothetical protein
MSSQRNWVVDFAIIEGFIGEIGFVLFLPIWIVFRMIWIEGSGGG